MSLTPKEQWLYDYVSSGEFKRRRFEAIRQQHASDWGYEITMNHVKVMGHSIRKKGLTMRVLGAGYSTTGPAKSPLAVMQEEQDRWSGRK